VSTKPTLPTLRDVADLAGVSSTTASMALSGRTGSAHISPASILKVQAAAKHLGYRGNYHARTLSSGRSYTLGLATGAGPISILEHDFFNHICGGVEAAARARGYDVLLIGGTEALEPLERAQSHLEARRIDALIVLRYLYPAIPAELAHCHLPVVVVHGQDQPLLPAVFFDPAPGIQAAVRHLSDLGHRRLLWIGVADTDTPRLVAVQAAVRDAGLELEPLLLPRPHSITSARSYTAHCHAVLADLVLPGHGTAVLCYNDELALALLSVLTARGIAVPEHLSVIGFDDRFADYAVPPLTTISHELAELGTASVSLALDLLENRVAPSPAPRVRVAARLVVRSSTAAVRSQAVHRP